MVFKCAAKKPWGISSAQAKKIEKTGLLRLFPPDLFLLLFWILEYIHGCAFMPLSKIESFVLGKYFHKSNFQ
jgi:hypothetical protein